MKMSKKVIFLMMGVLMLIIAGCSKDKEAETKTVIGGEELSTDDIRDYEVDDGFDFNFKDSLLVKILDTYYGKLEGVDEAFDQYIEQMEEQGVEFTDTEKKQLKNQMEYSTQLQDAYNDLVELDEEKVNKEFEKGFPVINVEHVVLYPEAVEKDSGIVKEVEEQLSKVETPEDYEALRIKLEEEGTGHMLMSVMSKTTIIPGFESIFDKEVGESEVFGEGNYKSVMKVVEKRNGTEDEVWESLRNQEILEKYSDITNLIFDMEKKFDDLKLSDEVKELLKEKPEDTVKGSDEAGEDVVDEEVVEEEKETEKKEDKKKKEDK